VVLRAEDRRGPRIGFVCVGFRSGPRARILPIARLTALPLRRAHRALLDHAECIGVLK